MLRMPNTPTSPKAYLDTLPDHRRAALRKLRTAINKGLPKGYKEGIQYGMIGWFVPHSQYAWGYHCDPKQPVPFASIASQKSHVGLYLFCLYTDPKAVARFSKAWKAGGRRLDMGKSCIRIKDKDLDDIPFDLITETIASIPLDQFITTYERLIPAAVMKKRANAGAPAKKAAKKKATRKKAAKKKTTPRKKSAKKRPAKKKATRKKTAKKKAARRR